MPKTSAFCRPIFILFLMLSPLSAGLAKPNQQDWGSGQITLPDGRSMLKLEFADTDPLREYGLMNRERLEEDHGMLFVFTTEAVQYMWMKNTLIPLDVLFLDRSGRIVSMLIEVPPCQEDPCVIYNSNMPATYMLEVNAGYIEKHKLAPRQSLSIQQQNRQR